ncbi:MAG TPA: hypothetical protein DDX11_05335 [Candidatus Peribacter riflensis]|nr:hypothetical protein [Candidatus Peribacter riflensis]
MLSLCVVSPVLAATKDCASVQQKSGGARAVATAGGGAAYQKCLFDEQEATIKQQLASYKNLIDRSKESVKTAYDAKINEENFTWKDVDLHMQSEEAERKLRVAQLGKDKEHAEQVQIEKNLLSRLQKIRSLTSSVHSKKVGRLQKRREAELSDYDSSLAEYELKLRQQKMAAF